MKTSTKIIAAPGLLLEASDPAQVAAPVNSAPAAGVYGRNSARTTFGMFGIWFHQPRKAKAAKVTEGARPTRHSPRALNFALCLLAFPMIAPLAGAQSAAAPAKAVLITDLKVGDWAEVSPLTGITDRDAVPNGNPPQWVTVTIAGPYDPRGSYKVSQGGIVASVCAYSTCIRRHTPTAAELATQQGSAAAMQARPTGPIGGKFGAREPATCPNRKTPPNATNAKQYFACDWEANLRPLELDLVGDVAIELASPRPFNYSQDRNYSGIDVRSVVYDARGKFTSYICTANSPQLNDFANSHNCNAFPYPAAAGLCYKDTWGDWHCRMGFTSSSPMLRDQMPPRGF